MRFIKKTILIFLCLLSFGVFDLSVVNATEVLDDSNNIIEEEKVKLTYDALGGKTTLTYVVVNTNETVTVSGKTPLKKGYKFLGWDTENTAANVVYKKGDVITMTDDITLYAVYGKKVKVSLDLNNGKASKKYVYMYTNSTYSLPTPKRTGYTFKGWYTSETSNGVLIDSNTKVTKTKSHYVYALWEANTYTITYNLNGGVNSTKNKESYKITSSTFKLYSPTKKGYTFKGWYTSSKYKTKLTSIKKGSYGNKTLYAKWQVNKYNIIYNGNGATSGSTKKQTNLNATNSYEIRKNGFSRKGYKFVGWNTKADGSGISYSPSQIVKGLGNKNGVNIKLYAQWEVINYTITYVNDGIYTDDYVNKKTYTVEDSFSFYLPRDIADGRPGYYFSGWYTDYSYSERIYQVKKGTTGDIVIYGKWYVPKSPSEVAIDHDVSKEIIVDAEDNDISNDEYVIQVTFNAPSDYKLYWVSDDKSIASASWDDEWNGNTIKLRIKPGTSRGTTTLTIGSRKCEYYRDKYGELQLYCTYYKKIPITVTVPDHWDEIKVIMPDVLVDEDGIELKVDSAKITDQDWNNYTFELSTTLQKAISSSSETFSGKYIYYYDKYGNLLGNNSIYISGLKYSTVGNKYSDIDEYVPLGTKKIIYGREYDTTGDLPYEYSSGEHLWDDVTILTPNKIIDNDSFGKQMELINYGYFDEDIKNKEYKFSALLKLTNFVDGDNKDYETTIYFYDKDGNLLSSKDIKLENVKLNSLYKIAVDVPNNTKTIAFNKDYYLTGVDPTLNEPWEDLEIEFPQNIVADDKKYDYGFDNGKVEYTYLNDDYYGIDLSYVVSYVPTKSTSYNTYLYMTTYDASGEVISSNKYIVLESGHALLDTVNTIIPIDKEVKKIVISTSYIKN